MIMRQTGGVMIWVQKVKDHADNRRPCVAVSNSLNNKHFYYNKGHIQLIYWSPLTATQANDF